MSRPARARELKRLCCTQALYGAGAALSPLRFYSDDTYKGIRKPRHAALDAASSGVKFRCVTVFNAAGPRVGARGDDVPFFLLKLSRCILRRAVRALMVYNFLDARGRAANFLISA